MAVTAYQVFRELKGADETLEESRVKEILDSLDIDIIRNEIESTLSLKAFTENDKIRGLNPYDRFPAARHRKAVLVGVYVNDVLSFIEHHVDGNFIKEENLEESKNALKDKFVDMLLLTRISKEVLDRL